MLGICLVLVPIFRSHHVCVDVRGCRQCFACGFFFVPVGMTWERNTLENPGGRRILLRGRTMLGKKSAQAENLAKHPFTERNEEIIMNQKIVRFLTAQTISLFGSSLVQYAIVWYIVLHTSSGKMLTLSTICGFAPQILVGLFAGAFIDRYDRKWLIMISDSVIAIATLLLAIAFLTGHKSMWMLFVVLMVRSGGTGIQTPTVNSIIPLLAKPEQLVRVNSINSTLSSIMMFLAPVLSGVIFSVTSLEAALFIDVVTAVIGVGITFGIDIPFVRKEGNGAAGAATAIRELGEGYAYIRRHSFIGKLLLFQIAVMILISPSAFLTPLMVSRSFGPEVWRLTASEMTYSLGMILGGILMTAWGGFKQKAHTILLAGAAYGGIMIGLGTSGFFALYLMFNAWIGITSPCYSASITSLIQEKAEPSVHGRVFSIMQVATSCSLPLGMAICGPLSDITDIGTILVTAGVCVFGITALTFIKGGLRDQKVEEI